MLAFYILAFGVWLAWIYVHYNYGDRPTSYAWFVVMLALGGFEYGKGMILLIKEIPTLSVATGMALVATIIMLAYQSQRREELAEGLGALEAGEAG